MTADLDPRWEWVDARRLCDVKPTYLRGPCNHLERVDVESCVTGETVAQLCLTCDAQLPARWLSRFDPPTTAELRVPEGPPTEYEARYRAMWDRLVDLDQQLNPDPSIVVPRIH